MTAFLVGVEMGGLGKAARLAIVLLDFVDDGAEFSRYELLFLDTSIGTGSSSALVQISEVP